LTKRIEQQNDDHQDKYQAGFRPGGSTIDHIHTLNQLTEKAREYNLPLSMTFVDYEKAIDSVGTNTILKALNDQEVHPQYIKLIQNICASAASIIQLDTEGSTFKLNRGVRQGDSMSPKLSILSLQSIFNKLNWQERAFGYKIGNTYLNNLRFADDIVLVAKTPQELQIMVTELHNESNKIGLKMNKSKTKTMFINTIPTNINIGNEILEMIVHYIYLGQLIDLEWGQLREMRRRISMTWTKFG